MRFLFSRDGWVAHAYRVRDVEQIATEFASNGEPYAVFVDNNLGSRPEYLRAVCRGLRPLEKIWSAAVTLDVTDDPTLVRQMALAGCTGDVVSLQTFESHLAPAHQARPGAYCVASARGVDA